MLKPNAASDTDWYTSNDVIDIENQLGYWPMNGLVHGSTACAQAPRKG
jgi:hypothetical protein